MYIFGFYISLIIEYDKLVINKYKTHITISGVLRDFMSQK